MELNQYMDHTLLKQNATEDQLAKLCDEAREWHFKTVSINGTWTRFAADRLAGSGVGVTTCISFPLGACSTAGKVAEARQAVADGTTEIDMVLNVGKLLSGDDDYHARHRGRGGGRAGSPGQGDPGVLPADGRPNRARVQVRRGRRRSLRKDVDRLQHRRRHGA